MKDQEIGPFASSVDPVFLLFLKKPVQSLLLLVGEAWPVVCLFDGIQISRKEGGVDEMRPLPFHTVPLLGVKSPTDLFTLFVHGLLNVHLTQISEVLSEN